MRFFTDQYFSDAQKSKLLEDSHLVEHPSITLEETGIQRHIDKPVFYMERQQEKRADELVLIEEGDDPTPVTDLSAVLLVTLVALFGALFVLDTLLG